MINEENKIQQSTGRTGGQKSTSQRMTKVGRHGADQLFVSNPQKELRMLSRVGVPKGIEAPRTMEERVKLIQNLISDGLGISVPDEVPNKIGFNISTDSQRRILLAVFQRLTDTDYKGDFQIPNQDILNKKYKNKEKSVEALTKGYNIIPTSTHIGGAYQNIEFTPIIRFTQSELMREAGFNPDAGEDFRDFKKALGDLMLKQHFLMWTRYKRDGEGHIVIGKDGKTEFELVSTFSTALNVEAILDPSTKSLLYYEISPSPVFLDEISREYGGTNGGYFILIPRDSYDEVREAYNKRFPTRGKIVPDVIQTFCFWLRLKVVEIQSNDRNPFKKKKNPETLRISFIDICQVLKYGEKTIKSQKKRISNRLLDGFAIAKDLKYISDYQEDIINGEYIITLNPDFYPNHFTPEERDEEKNTSKKTTKKSSPRKRKKNENQVENRFKNSFLFREMQK